MKRDNLARLAQFKLDERRRQLAQLEQMMAEFTRMAEDLDSQIHAEEARSGITDREHFAYPTFAAAARTRRDNLATSVRDLQTRIKAAELSLEEAREEYAHAEKLEQRSAAGELKEAAR